MGWNFIIDSVVRYFMCLSTNDNMGVINAKLAQLLTEVVSEFNAGDGTYLDPIDRVVRVFAVFYLDTGA
jgi:hypothetical protein